MNELILVSTVRTNFLVSLTILTRGDEVHTAYSCTFQLLVDISHMSFSIP